MRISAEPFTPELAAEILPLAQKCWEESTETKKETCAYYGERDFAVEPDTEAYLRLAEQGLLLVVTLRDEKLLGYVMGILYPSLHHKKILCAIGDSIYVEPDYRSYTGVMAARFEDEMRGRDVQIIGWPTTPDSSVYQVLKARHYVADDVVMELRLKCA